MARTIDILLLLALPASGKSEVRRYLDHLDPKARRADLGLGTPIQLDDYPYVHMMRRISEELRSLGEDPAFFADDAASLLEPRDWGTLIRLLNEDYAALDTDPGEPDEPGTWLLDRFERARGGIGAAPLFAGLSAQTLGTLAAAVDDEAAVLAAGLPRRVPDGTVVMEFARGGPAGADLPLPAPLGYRYSLSQLSPEILRRATVLYVWVTPEESRRRNRERAKPGRDGDASILHHGVPEFVMEHDYGTDDIGWLIDNAEQEGTIRIDTATDAFHVPIARFDNRVDRTSFLRDEPEEWPPDQVADLHASLTAALGSLEPSV
jgi:hypothetical protein